jgi:amino acid adenylation domain-containing protein
VTVQTATPPAAAGVAADPSARMHSGFERQAALRPEAPCLRHRDTVWTYAEVEAAANRLAWWLMGRGIGPDRLVVLHLERSPELVVLILAVLKAGGAYLPLDPALDKAGLADRLCAAAPALIVSDAIEAFPAEEAGLVLRPADVWALAADRDTARPSCAAGAHDLAYAIFTSGSTGRPHLVGVAHRNITHVIGFSCTALFVPEDLCFVPFIDSISADACVHQLFTTLGLGGTLLVERDIASLLRSPWLARITALGTTPSVLIGLLEVAELPRTIRVLTLGGEVIPAALLDRLRSMPSLRAAFNFYGPAEATIYATVARLLDPREGITALRDAPCGRVIGHPIEGTQIAIVGPDGQAVPDGELGEIRIIGPGVARGYIGEATLTAERFGPSPLPGHAGEGCYRTGDLGRRLADGAILFEGRADDQLKVNGMRLEPAEVEAQIELLTGVLRAAVILRPARASEEGRQRSDLVAFVVTEPGVEIAGLRRRLKACLPAVMIPRAFFRVDRLPLTASGKVDRRALVAADGAGGSAADGSAVAAPEDQSIDDSVLAAWRTALNRPQLGPEDNFFDAGGDSLASAQILVAVERQLGGPLDLEAVAELSTAAAMAAALRAHVAKAAVVPAEDWGAIWRKQKAYVAAWTGHRHRPGAMIVTLNTTATRPGLARPGSARPDLFWCCQGHEELSALAAELGPDQPLHGMRSGHLVMEYTPETMAAMARCYVEEMVVIQPDGPFRIGGNCQAARIARAMAVELRRLGRSVSHLMLMEPYDFTPYDEPVALFIGRDSHAINPYGRLPDPEAEFRAAYRGGFTVTMIDGGHGEFFKPRHIPSLGRAIRSYLGTEACPPDTAEAEMARIKAVIAPHIDGEFYARQLGRDLGRDAMITHYVTVGHRSGFNPRADFDSEYYRRSNADVMSSGVNPFLHYLEVGRAEGRAGCKPGAGRTDATAGFIRSSGAFACDHYRAQAGEAVASLAEADLIRHYLDTGWRLGLDPSPDFVTRFYRLRSPDVVLNGINPFYHYLRWGRREGRRGSPAECARDRSLAPEFAILAANFDEAWYRERYPQIVENNIDPVLHYLHFGWRLGHDPRPDVSTKAIMAVFKRTDWEGINPFHLALIKGYAGHDQRRDNLRDLEILAPLFDADWYRERYGSAAALSLTELEHYYYFGRFAGNEPHPLFSTPWYLQQKGQGRDALPAADAALHFLNAPRDSLISPHPLFHPAFYLSQAGAVPEDANPLLHYLSCTTSETITDPHPLFAARWYLRINDDVERAQLNPLYHFMRSGGLQRRDPNPLFQSDWYAGTQMGAQERQEIPLLHYLRHAADGVHLNPNRSFDSAWYCRANPDRLHEWGDPLSHYIVHGAAGNHAPGPAINGLDYAAAFRRKLAAVVEAFASADRVVPRKRAGSAGGASRARQITIVIGMHRSGTSLAAHVLHRLGIDMSEDNRISSDNRKGHWERPAIVAFHDRILRVFDRGWFDPRHVLALPAEWWLHPEVRSIRTDLAAFLKRTFAARGHVGFKDPRTARLLPLWDGLCEELKLEPCYVVCARNPGQVARSLQLRDALTPQEAAYRWMVYNSHAVLGLSNRPICIIPYEAWFADGQANIDRLASHRGQPAILPDFVIDRLQARLADPLLRHDEVCAATGGVSAATALYQAILDSVPERQFNAAARAQAEAFIGFEALVQPLLTPSCGAAGP